MSRIEFELDGTEIAQRRVQTLAIVPSFDVFKEGCAGLSPRGKALAGTFGFERAEKALHGCVVKAISNPAHTDLAVVGRQRILIRFAGVLAALIRMMQQALGWVAFQHGHLQRLFHQRSFHVIGHGPAHDLPRKQVHDYCQVQPTFRRVDVGDIADPFLIHRRGGEILVQQVRSWYGLGISLSGGRRAFMYFSTDYPVQAHQAGDAMPPAGHALALQSDLDARAAIGLSARSVLFLDLRH